MKKPAAWALAAMVAAAAWGATPAVWEHVGRIVGSDGKPLTGEQNLEVRLYASMTATEVLWGRRAKAVLDADGRFSLRLDDALEPLEGSPTNSLESVLAAGPVFAEAEAAGEAMTPRAAVAATPYALSATGAGGAAGDFGVEKDLTVHGKTAVSSFRTESAEASGDVDVAGTLSVGGDLAVEGAIAWGARSGIGVMPLGSIIMWFGDGNSPPDGWTLCNGENGTPDLRGRFPVGAGGQYAAGDTGGAETVALALEQMPAHTHGLGAYGLERGHSGSDYTEGHDNVWITGGSAQTDPAGGPDGGEEGSADPHENLPPFMALHYIMRVE